MPIERPPTSTILWVPGAISSTVPTTYFGIVSPGVDAGLAVDARREVVQLASVLEHELRLEAVRQLRIRQARVWRIEVPVRVVRGEHQLVLKPGCLLQQLHELVRLVRLLHRLGGEPEVLREVLRRLAPKPRHLAAQLRPGGIHPPRQRRHPPEAALDQYHLQLREPFEDALEDET